MVTAAGAATAAAISADIWRQCRFAWPAAASRSTITVQVEEAG